MQDELNTEKPTNILRVAVDVVLVLEISLVIAKQMIAMGCVLLTSGGKCDEPIRPWIIVTICLFGVHILLVLFWRFVRKSLPEGLKQPTKSFRNLFHVILQLSLLVWVIFGSVWLYGDFSDCADGTCYVDFTGGFVVTLTTLLLYYVLAGMSGLLMLFWCIGRGLLTKSQYDQI